MRCIVFLLFLPVFFADCQPLRDINFSYLYSQKEAFTFRMNPVRGSERWDVYYKLQVGDTLTGTTGYTIQWEIRDGLNTREGERVAANEVLTLPGSASSLEGVVKIPLSQTIRICVARVKRDDKVWIFYAVLEPKYPVTAMLKSDNKALLEGYVPVGASATGFEDRTTYVAWYNDVFPPAVPAFSESAARVAPAITPDSTWTVAPGETVTFSKKGLYLLQTDTTAAEGVTIRAEDDYPKLARVESLADPLTYVCTSQEVARVRQAKGDKKAFDKVILSITQDQERARIFMKSYYRRVEIANQLFTSYKEGWKTDRGMIYIVFGPPDQVYKTSERELWYYKNSDYKINFEFTKSPTLFDPGNYVLLRQKRIATQVYEVIDLWRNARF